MWQRKPVNLWRVYFSTPTLKGKELTEEKSKSATTHPAVELYLLQKLELQKLNKAIHRRNRRIANLSARLSYLEKYCQKPCLDGCGAMVVPPSVICRKCAAENMLAMVEAVSEDAGG